MNTPDTEKCQHCGGTNFTYTGCLKCGAPVCCLDCCKETESRTTPDTEWRERLWEWVETAPSGVEVLNCYPESVVAIIEQALSSRDTYWKERVKERDDYWYAVVEDLGKSIR